MRRAGEKLFIGYAAPTITQTDGTRAHIFVAALSASSYAYACATPRETMADWLESTARALVFIGGVPQLIVHDNPKAMIADANRYEPRRRVVQAGLICWWKFHGRNSSTRLTGWSAICASTWRNQASGSTPFSLAEPINE